LKGAAAAEVGSTFFVDIKPVKHQLEVARREQ